jgi:pyrimidine oxygenase
MGLWPGQQHFSERYDYLTEYTTILKNLWETGRTDLKGKFFTMDNCAVLPMPSRRIPLVCAGQSERGMKFAADYCDYNFCGASGINAPENFVSTVERLNAQAVRSGRDVGCMVPVMIIADETDAGATAKWEHYVAGVDTEAIANRRKQAAGDPSAAKESTAGRMLSQPTLLPTDMAKIIGSYETVASMLDLIAAIPGVKGIMLTFDDFVRGVEQFGERIQPLMRCREQTAVLS